MGRFCFQCGGDADESDHRDRCDGRQGRVEAGILEPARRDLSVVGMVHRDDPHTSTEAAVAVAFRRNELHEKVRAAFRGHGRMSDETLETLPEFDGYGPSTIRKRRSELYQHGELVAVGETTNTRGRTMLIWDLAEGTK